MKPARQVVTRSPHRSVGLVNAGWLQQESIEWESPHEQRFIHCVLLLPNLVALKHQPFKIEYRDAAGRLHKYTPDFLVELKDGVRVVVEVKPTRFVDKYRTEFDAAASQLRDAGGQFYVLTEKQVQKDRAKRARLWLKFARQGAADADTVPVLRRVAAAPDGIPYGELRDLGFSEGAILHLLGRRYLKTNAQFELNPETRLVAIDRGDLGNERIQFDSWFDCSPWRTNMAS
jgi:TnsA endonuclease N terminal